MGRVNNLSLNGFCSSSIPMTMRIGGLLRKSMLLKSFTTCVYIVVKIHSRDCQCTLGIMGHKKVSNSSSIVKYSMFKKHHHSFEPPFITVKI
jgi:hypothetical protein